MSKYFEDTMQGLLEAVEIQKGNLPLVSHEGMPATTYHVAETDAEPCIINALGYEVQLVKKA